MTAGTNDEGNSGEVELWCGCELMLAGNRTFIHLWKCKKKAEKSSSHEFSDLLRRRKVFLGANPEILSGGVSG